MKKAVFLGLFLALALVYSVTADDFPTYSTNSTNGSVAGTDVLHSLQWSDDSGLSGYIFEFCNGTWNGTDCFLARNQTTIQLQDANTENLDDVETTDKNVIYYTDNRFHIKFNISGITSVDDAELCLNVTGVGADWDGVINVSRIDNQTWSEDDAIAALDAMGVDNELTFSSVFTSGGFDCVDVTSIVNADIGFGNDNCSFKIIDSDDTGNTPDSKDVSGVGWVGTYDAGEQDYVLLTTKEGATTAHRPYLNISYYTSPPSNAWVNDTFVSMTGTSAWSNVSKYVNTTVGSIIAWRVHANDSADQWTRSLTYSYTTVAGEFYDVTLLTPADDYTTTDLTPSHTFIYDASYATASCTLYYNSTALATNSSVLEGVTTTLTVDNNQLDGQYAWWVTCTNGTDTETSATRYITVYLNTTETMTFNFTPYSEIITISLPRRYNVTAATWNMTGYQITRGTSVDTYTGVCDGISDTSNLNMLTTDGTYLYLGCEVTSTPNRGYLARLFMNGTYTGTKWNLTESSEITSKVFNAVYTNGTDIWIAAQTPTRIYQFNMTMGYIQNFTPARAYFDLTGNATSFFAHDGFKVYTLNSTFVELSNFTVPASTRGITTDNNFIWTMTASIVYKFNMDGTDTDINFTVLQGYGGMNHNNNDLFYPDNANEFIQVAVLTTRYPPNATIDTGDDGSTDYTNMTEFNTSETIDLNVTAINDYLHDTCTADWQTGSCDVPFNVSSDGGGILGISGINITGGYLDAVGGCSEGYYESSLYFWFAEEADLIGANGSAEYVITDVSSGSVYNTSVSNVANFTICTFGNSTYTVNMTLIYWNESSDQRSYYLYHGSIGSQTPENLTLYLTPSGASEKVEVTVKDANDNTVPDAYVNIQRYYVDEDAYRTVTIGKTDSTGKFLTYLYTDTVYYRFTISLAGVVSNTYSAMTITDTTDDPELLTLYTTVGETQFFDIRKNIGGSCYTNYTTNYTICTVADATGLLTSARLIVEHSELAGPERICDKSGTGSAITLSCFLGADANGTYPYKLIITPSPNPPFVFGTGYAYFAEVTVFGDYGLFPALLLVLATATVAIFNAPLGAIMAVVGLGAGVALNLIEMSGASLVSLLIVAVLIFMKGRNV